MLFILTIECKASPPLQKLVLVGNWYVYQAVHFRPIFLGLLHCLD
jgi:hypothetical protein